MFDFYGSQTITMWFIPDSLKKDRATGSFVESDFLAMQGVPTT